MARQPRASKLTANAGIGLIRIASVSQLLLLVSSAQQRVHYLRAPGYAGNPPGLAMGASLYAHHRNPLLALPSVATLAVGRLG